MKPIHPARDWLYRWKLEEFDTTTGTWQPRSGLSPQCYLSATQTPGTPLAGTTVTLTERAPNTGDYTGPLDAPLVTAAIGTKVSQKVYEICVVAGDYQDAVPLLVREIELLV